ncbi:MAG TPA: ATP-binding protein [Nitrospirales bacterium]
MKTPLQSLLSQYTRALEDHLAGGGETALHEAYELGRRSLAEGLGLLDLASIHYEALMTILLRRSFTEDFSLTVKAGANFFAESLSPFEMTHRGYREANVALRHLNEKLEEEAKRIAHALHDEAGQLLASVHLALEEVARELPPPAGDRLQKVRGLLDQIEMQLRRLSHELRPTILDDLGLLPALEFLSTGVSARTRVLIRLEGSLEERLPHVIETALYRIVQEALTNVTKHAQATLVTVCLQREDQLVRCVIRDDGIGCDPAVVLGPRVDRGLGFVGIQERLNSLRGRLQIVSFPGRGMELHITIPLET